jgi:hypothetical protein
MPTPAIHIWQPSNARVLSLTGSVPSTSSSIVSMISALASGATTATAASGALLSWPAKDPNDVLDYAIDVSDVLVGDAGDAIATLDLTIAPNASGDLALNASSAAGTVAVMWFSGGNVGTTYVVTISISTTSGRTIARAVQLPVLSLTDISSNTTAELTTQLGTVLTDSNGNALTLGS